MNEKLIEVDKTTAFREPACNRDYICLSKEDSKDKFKEIMFYVCLAIGILLLGALCVAALRYSSTSYQ